MRLAATGCQLLVGPCPCSWELNTVEFSSKRLWSKVNHLTPILLEVFRPSGCQARFLLGLCPGKSSSNSEGLSFPSCLL